MTGEAVSLTSFISLNPDTKIMREQEQKKSPYFDIKALSDYLQIKVSTLYAWSAQNKIPSIKIHGVIRFQKDEINAWLEDFRQKKPKEKKEVFKGKGCDIDSMIARAKREVYNGQCGETRPESVHGKEKQDGAV